MLFLLCSLGRLRSIIVVAVTRVLRNPTLIIFCAFFPHPSTPKLPPSSLSHELLPTAFSLRPRLTLDLFQPPPPLSSFTIFFASPCDRPPPSPPILLHHNPRLQTSTVNITPSTPLIERPAQPLYKRGLAAPSSARQLSSPLQFASRHLHWPCDSSAPASAISSMSISDIDTPCGLPVASTNNGLHSSSWRRSGTIVAIPHPLPMSGYEPEFLGIVIFATTTSRSSGPLIDYAPIIKL